MLWLYSYIVHVTSQHCCPIPIPLFSDIPIAVPKWGFPEIGVPLNHPFLVGALEHLF